MTNAVKFVDGKDDLIEGMLAPFGGPIAGKDLDGEFFSANTDFELEWFGDWQRPLLFGHGYDPALKTSVVGRIKVEPTDKGLWMQAQLDKKHAYYEQIRDLVADGLGLSSGSVDHLTDIDAKSGEIKAWPLIEGSLTPTPANPDAAAKYATKSVDIVEHLAVLGVAVPDELADVQPEATVEQDVEPATKDATKDSAAWDASSAASLISQLAGMLGNVEDEALKRDLRTAIDALTAFMTANIAAIKAAPLTSQSLHDAAVASGAKCASEPEPVPPEPLLAIAGKSAETEEPVDLEAFARELRELAVSEAVKEAKNILG